VVDVRRDVGIEHGDIHDLDVRQVPADITVVQISSEELSEVVGVASNPQIPVVANEEFGLALDPMRLSKRDADFRPEVAEWSLRC
jgi:hypothetical protein